MANATLKTRLIINNKTAAEWNESATFVPLKGEICLYIDQKKAKIGDGATSIANLPFAWLTSEEVQQLITDASHSHSNKAILDATTASFTTELMKKLNGIAAGAEVNQNAFSKIAVGDTTIEADTKTDTLTLVGSNVTITPDATNDKVTIGVNAASTSTKGIVQLTNSTSSTSTTTAATPSSVKSAYDLANTAKNDAATAQATADSKIGSVSLATGTNNGTVKLTVDGTTTDNIAVKGLGSAAYTNVSEYATAAQGTKADNAMPKSGGTFTGAVTLHADPSAALGAATKQYVDNQITSKIAAADAMVFKGTLGTGGTITAVPTTNVVKGDTYKIITAGTYAGSACKVGDLIIALNSGSVTADANNWAYVPSGDENETTIKYSKTTHNLTTTAKTGAITLAEGATKQVDTAISDASTSTNIPTTAAVAAYVNGKVDGVNSTLSEHTSNTTIHINAEERTKWNAAEPNQNAFSKVVVGSTTVEADSKTDSLTLVAGTNVTITPDAANDKITIAAKDTTYSDMTGATTTAAGAHGLVPAPAAGEANRYLRSDGTWVIPPDTKYSAAGTSLGLVKTGGDVTIESGVITVNDDSHNHVISNVDGLQAALDGKAPTEHGVHVTYSTDAPKANGTATPGVAVSVSRSDHVHPLQTTVSGNAGSATKLKTARNFSITGAATAAAVSFDGTQDVALSVTALNAINLYINSSDILILDGSI